jgi:hypothetical protein
MASIAVGTAAGPVTAFGAYGYCITSTVGYASLGLWGIGAALGFDFFMNDSKFMTDYLAGPLGRGIDTIARMRGTGESNDAYIKRTAVGTPQMFNEASAEYRARTEGKGMMLGWTREESWFDFRDRRDKAQQLYDQGWEKYFRDNVPKWSYSHEESIPRGFITAKMPGWSMPFGMDTGKQDTAGSVSSITTSTETLPPSITVTTTTADTLSPSTTVTTTSTTSAPVVKETPAAEIAIKDEPAPTPTAEPSVTVSEPPVTTTTEEPLTPSSMVTTTTAETLSPSTTETTVTETLEATSTTATTLTPATTTTEPPAVKETPIPEPMAMEEIVEDPFAAEFGDEEEYDPYRDEL